MNLERRDKTSESLRATARRDTSFRFCPVALNLSELIERPTHSLRDARVEGCKTAAAVPSPVVEASSRRQDEKKRWKFIPR